MLMQDIEVKVYRSHIKIPVIFFVPAAFLASVYVLLYLYLNSTLFLDTLQSNLNTMLPGTVSAKKLKFDATLMSVEVHEARVLARKGNEVIRAEEVKARVNPLVLMTRRIEVDRIRVKRGGVHMTIPEGDEPVDMMDAIGLGGSDEDEDEDAEPTVSVSLRDIQCAECFYRLTRTSMDIQVPRVDIPDGSIDIGANLVMKVPALDVADLRVDFAPEMFGFEPRRGHWILDGEDVRIRNWHWTNEGFSVEEVAVQVDGVQISATGDMRFPGGDDDPSGGMIYWGKGEIRIPVWTPVGHYFISDHVHGELYADIAVEGDFNDIVGAFELTSPYLEAAGIHMTNLRGRGGLDDDVVYLDWATGEMHGGRVEVDDVFFSMFEGIFAGEARFEDVDPEGVLGDFGFDYPWLAGRGKGAATVLGYVPFDPEYSFGEHPYSRRIIEATRPVVWVNLDDDLVVNRASREVLPGTRIRVRRGIGVWASLDTVGVPEATVNMDSVDAGISDFYLNYQTNHLVSLGNRPARIRLTSADFGGLMASYGVRGMSGGMTAMLAATGLMNFPEVDYEIDVTNMGFGSSALNASGVNIRMAGELANGRLGAREARIASPRGSARARGWLQVLRNPVGILDPETGKQTSEFLYPSRHAADLDWEVDDLDVSMFKAFLPSLVGPRGRAFAKGSLKETIERPELIVDGRIEQGEVLGQPLRALEVQGGLSPTEAQLSRFVIDAGVAGRVEGSGRFGLSDERFLFELEGRDLNLDKVVLLRDRVPVLLEGGGFFELHGSGTPDEPNVAGYLVFENLKAAGRSMGDLSVVANTLDDTVHFVGALLPWITMNFELPLDEESPYYARLGLDHLELKSAIDEIRESNLIDRAEATGSVEVFVERDLSRYQVLANLSEVRADTLGREFVNDGPIIVGLNDGNLLQVQQARVGADGKFVSVQGGLFLDQALLDVQLEGDLDLALVNSFRMTFPEFFPDALIEAKGVLNLEANLSGTPGSLVADGYVNFNPTEILLRDLADALYVTSGTIRFDRNGLRIDDAAPLRGRALQGQFELLGSMALNGLDARDLDLRVQAVNMSYRVPDVANLTFSTDLRLRAPELERYDTWEVDGQVDIVDGLYYENISIFQEQFTNRLLGAFNRKTTSYEASVVERFPMLEEIDFDVFVRARDGFRIESEIDRLALDLDLRVDLRLQNTLFSPRLTGDIDVLDGRVTFQGERFDVRNGTLNFAGDPDNPFIDIIADSEVNNRCREPDIGEESRRSLSLTGSVGAEEQQIFNVILNVRGPLKNMDIRFESNPYADQRDILSLILTGCTVDQLTASSASSPTLEVALAPVLGWIEGTVQDVVEVEEFTITPSVDRLRTSVGDRLSRRLSWRLQVDTGLTEPTGGQLYQLNYKISDAWSAEVSESSRTEDDSFVIDFKLKYRLFLD